MVRSSGIFQYVDFPVFNMLEVLAHANTSMFEFSIYSEVLKPSKCQIFKFLIRWRVLAHSNMLMFEFLM